MNIRECRNDSEWDAFIKNNPETTFFHTLQWKKVIDETFSYSTHYISIKDSSDELVGVCPGFIQKVHYFKAFNSLPASDYGGPIIKKEDFKKKFNILLKYLQNYCVEKNIAYTKFCLTNNLEEVTFSQPNCVNLNKGVVEVDLKTTPSEIIWKSLFSSRQRRSIRQIEKKGFQAREAESFSDLKDFFLLYHKNMTYIGASPRPFRFIKNMWRILYPNNLRIWMLEKKDPISGILVFKYDHKTFCYYFGLDRNRCRNFSAFPFLAFNELKKAEAEGCNLVSLGSTPSDEKNSYYINKTRLGGKFRQQKLVWTPMNTRGRILISLMNKVFQSKKGIQDVLPGSMQKKITNLVRF